MTEKDTRQTTVRMDAKLLKQAKHAAVDSDLSLQVWIVNAIQEKLDREKAKRLRSNNN